MGAPLPEQVLSDLIRINTVNPPGNETVAARYLQELCAGYGLAGEVLESEPGRGSFILRLGEGKKRMLWLAHTDVVPAGEGWDFDPFGGEIRNGFVLGRGAMDCKSLVAAQICAALQLHSRGELNCTLIVAAVADEERGGTHGIRYLLTRHRDKIEADLAVNEGAEEPVRIGDKTVYFLQVGEKGTAWCHLTARGLSCHGSVPTLGDNAVVRMARALVRLADYQPPLMLIPAVEQLLTEMARLLGRRVEKWDAAAVDSLLAAIPERTFAEYLRACTRMTVSPNVVEGGQATNIVPDHCQARVDIRILPGQTREEVYHLVERLVGPGVEVEMPDYCAPTFSPADSEHFLLLKRVLARVTDNAPCLPCLSTGATDSRWLRQAGIPAYGVAVLAPSSDPGLRGTVHGRNERIDLASLKLLTEFFVELGRAYGKDDEGNG